MNENDLKNDQQSYMVCCNIAGSVFVKEYQFFVSQGGLPDNWGKNWIRIEASSIENARLQGTKLFANARPYENQAK